MCVLGLVDRGVRLSDLGGAALVRFIFSGVKMLLGLALSVINGTDLDRSVIFPTKTCLPVLYRLRSAAVHF